MSQPTLNDAMPALSYATPGPPRIERVTSFVLFFLQCNATIVMILSGFAFWWQLAAAAQNALTRGGYSEFAQSGVYSTTPFMLAAGVWTLCLIARRL